MATPLSPKQALNRAAALCSRSEQCAHDIREKLLRWGLDPDQADDAIARLKKEGFIDDDRYARAFAHDKFLYTGWGPIKIATMLRQKGIAQASIADALENISRDDQEQALMRALQAKWRSVQGREPRLARAALLRFAASRGYDTQMCYRCVNQITQIDGDDD